MRKVRVPVYGTPNKSTQIDPEATKGATIGRNLYNQDGTLYQPPAAAAPENLPATIWRRILEIPRNVKALASAAGTGLFAVTGDSTGAFRTIQPTANETTIADGDGVAGDPTVGLADLADSGAGTFKLLTRDAKGRVSGTADGTSGDVPEGANLYFTDARARTAAVADTITDGVTNVAPSQNAVFDALALKYDKAGGTVSGAIGAGGAAPVGGSSFTGNGFIYSVGALAGLSFGIRSGGNGWALYSPTGTAILNLDGTGDLWEWGGVAFQPTNDNGRQLGSSGRRFSVVYAATGAINTSDAREKTEPRDLTDAELGAASDIARLPSIYQWLYAIEEKGESARLHCSPTVQSVIACMEKHGLDPFRYGFVCYDEWDETPEVVESWEEERDDDGKVIREAGSEVVQEYRPAGDRYSLRPSELAHFIMRGLVYRLDRLEALESQRNVSLQPVG